MCESDLIGTIFLEDKDVLRVLWIKVWVVTCSGVLYHWGATAEIQTLTSSQHAVESFGAFQQAPWKTAEMLKEPVQLQ